MKSNDFVKLAHPNLKNIFYIAQHLETEDFSGRTHQFKRNFGAGNQILIDIN